MQLTGRSYLELYDDQGHRLPMDTKQLTAINYLKEPTLPAEVRYTTGRYWLVGCAMPLQPALVEMLVFKAPTNGRTKHHVAFATEGIAGYKHFDIDVAIAALSSKNHGLGEPYDTPVPQSVVDAARAMVHFDEERTPRKLDYPLVSLLRHPGGVNLLEALGKVCPEEPVLSLLELMAGRETTVTSLIALIGLYAKRAAITDDQLREVLQIMLREHRLAAARSLLGIN